MSFHGIHNKIDGYKIEDPPQEKLNWEKGKRIKEKDKEGKKERKGMKKRMLDRKIDRYIRASPLGTLYIYRWLDRCTEKNGWKTKLTNGCTDW